MLLAEFNQIYTLTFERRTKLEEKKKEYFL